MNTTGYDATITPVTETGDCDREECQADTLLARVDPDGDTPARTLCPTHRVEFLREVVDQ